MSESKERFAERLATAWAEEVSKFDRMLLALATGALALSIPLVRDLAAAPEPAQMQLIPFGWGSLILAFLLLLASSAISKTAIEARWKGDDTQGDRLSKWAWGFSLGAAVLFAAGAVLIMLFVWLNIK